MEERKFKSRSVKSSAGILNAREDLISRLPDSLLSQILFYLPTKEAVKTSVLSNRWRRLWLLVPSLDLDSREFPDYSVFVSFMERFLGFLREHMSCLHKLKLSIRKDEKYYSCVTRWIDFVAMHNKLEHLDVKCLLVKGMVLETIPVSLYICETLRYLRLYRVLLGEFESVSLPCLKSMSLEQNLYANEACLELLISSCPVLEDLSIVRRYDSDNVKVIRVHSMTLTSLSIAYYYDFSGDNDETENSIDDFDKENSWIFIDAPRLKCLSFDDDLSGNKIISNSGSLTQVNIFGSFCLDNYADAVDLRKGHMVRDFLNSISGVRAMKLSFEFIEDFRPLPQFCNLSSLEAELSIPPLKSLSTFLKSFPNLKSLILELCYGSLKQYELRRISSVPPCLLSSLEYVEIKSRFCDYRSEMVVVRYFADNSVNLKKLVLHLRDIMVEKDFLALSKLPSTCELVVC